MNRFKAARRGLAAGSERAAGKGEESFESRLCLLGCKLCEPGDLLCHVTCCLERQVAQSRYAVSIYGMSV